LNYTRDLRLNHRDSHHCVTGLLHTSLYSALRASVALRRCSNLLPEDWSNPRLKLGKLQFYIELHPQNGSRPRIVLGITGGCHHLTKEEG